MKTHENKRVRNGIKFSTNLTKNQPKFIVTKVRIDQSGPIRPNVMSTKWFSIKCHGSHLSM